MIGRALTQPMTAWLSQSKVSGSNNKIERINRKLIVYCHLEFSVFFALSKQILIVYSADCGRNQIQRFGLNAYIL